MIGPKTHPTDHMNWLLREMSLRMRETSEELICLIMASIVEAQINDEQPEDGKDHISVLLLMMIFIAFSMLCTLVTTNCVTEERRSYRDEFGWHRTTITGNGRRDEEAMTYLGQSYLGPGLLGPGLAFTQTRTTLIVPICVFLGLDQVGLAKEEKRLA